MEKPTGWILRLDFFMKEVTRGIIFNFLPREHTEGFEETDENGNKKQRFLVDGTTKNGEV